MKRSVAKRQWLTVREVTDLYGISRSTVSRYMRDGKIPFHRLPSGLIRFDPDELHAWMESKARGGRK